MANTFLSGLRFPQLFVLMAVILAIDLVIPDVIPLVDEILLALCTLLLASLKKSGRNRSEPLLEKKPPED